MDSRTTPLILVMVSLVCAIIPTVGAAVPAAIAQEEETSLGEDLARGTISDIDGGDNEVNGDAAADAGIDQDSTDTVTVNSNKDHQTVDQTDFNEFGDNTANFDTDQPAANVAVPIATPTPPPADGGLPPEGDVVFCLELVGETISCFDTLEQCELGRAFLADVISECEKFETPPPDAFLCVAEEGGISCIRE
jgi:hypothetical protein